VSDYRLRLPGPTAVPERVRQAIARPVLSHRGPEFTSTFLRAEQLLQPILGTRNRVFFFSSSGTGMMEAALVNVIAPGERVLVAVNGAFGERFAAIARALGARVDVVETEWGRAIDPAAIEMRVAATDFRAVVLVHNESSTGVVADLAAIGAVLRRRPTLLIVDSVSGLAGLEMRQDEWGVDIVVSSSQKALMCPPGLGIVSIGAKAWEVVSRPDRQARFYWDFRKCRASIEEESGTPFTTPVSLMAGLREALEMIHEEGVPRVLDRHRRLSAALRAGAAAIGLSCFTRESFSNTVVCLNVPAGLRGGEIVRHLYQGRRTVIAGSRNKLAGKVIRIGTMGYIDADDILTDLLYLEETLTALGAPVAAGAGVSAAAALLTQPNNHQEASHAG